MMRSSSSNSDALSNMDSPHSPLRFHSPLRSDLGDPPEVETDSPPYGSPAGSPGKPPDNSKAIVLVDGYTQCTPVHTPQAPNAGKSTPLTVSRAVKEEGPAATTTKLSGGGGGARVVTAILKRSKAEEMVKISALGFRLSEVVLCLISFSVMAADKTQGWSGDSYDRYKEYRYCLSVNVIAFVYSSFQAYDLAYYLITEKHTIHNRFRFPFDFFMDQKLWLNMALGL
ncbi:hypothetical protein SLEP1_g29236 [Rubroshorea leprosula]|uniref:CASP-like protein n=1 Tax=Rubroshorea leprosula TaxID=152421 RepID=A0AAV5K5M7_9ROSI|nr:hypothetical protein SLEP1_g29236 [Rubroshorea leprosula]